MDNAMLRSYLERLMTDGPTVRPQPRSNARTAYDLLSDVIDAIRTDPARLDMDHWLPYYDQERSFIEYAPDADRSSDCGTIGCLAGWCVVLRRHTLTNHASAGWIDVEAHALGMFPSSVTGVLDRIFLKTRRYSDGTLSEAEYRNRLEYDEDFSDEDPLPPGVTLLTKGTQAYVDDVLSELRQFQAAYAADLRAHVYGDTP